MKASHNRDSYSLTRLIVFHEGEHTISVSQKDERCFNRHSSYDYSNCRIIVMKIEKDADGLEGLEVKYMQGA